MRTLFCRLAILMAEPHPRLTQKQLAQETGLGTSTVNRLVNNSFSRVDRQTIETLCNYFNRDVSDLFEMREVAEAKRR